ncbi:MAG: ArsR family transcriptional regulator [Haloglomus sp.]
MSNDASASEDSILECEECLPPADAFAIVGNETRLHILEALWAADRPAAFSELRRSVGMRDSAQFNYHLSKLRGQFVNKTEEGYEFRQAGEAIVRAVLAGTYNQDPELEPFPVDGECVACDGGLEAIYEDEHLEIRCAECDRPHGGFHFPPGGLEDRTREEVLSAFNQRARHLACLTADGVCPDCNGRVETTLEEAYDDLDELDVVVRHECQRCGNSTISSIGLALLDDAEIVSFYRDHGIDLNAVRFWTLEWCITDRYTEILSRDPWRLRVTVPLGDEELRVTVDGDLVVQHTERRARSGDAATDATTPTDAGDADEQVEQDA